MKKVELATWGVVAACAACCTIPLALPTVSALSLAGLAPLVFGSIHVETVVTAMLLIATAGVLVWAAAWFHKRRLNSCETSQRLGSCTVEGNVGSVSCACSRSTS